jgi:hypothetical protein
MLIFASLVVLVLASFNIYQYQQNHKLMRELLALNYGMNPYCKKTAKEPVKTHEVGIPEGTPELEEEKQEKEEIPTKVDKSLFLDDWRDEEEVSGEEQ